MQCQAEPCSHCSDHSISDDGRGYLASGYLPLCEACPYNLSPARAEREHRAFDAVTQLSGEHASMDRARRAETVRPEECINLPLREGQAFEFNNALAHAVRNEGPGDRVHLVIDVAERHYDRATRLRKGQVCQYIGGRVNCEPDAAIKKSKPRDQARQHARAW